MGEQATHWEKFPATHTRPTFVRVKDGTGNVSDHEPNYLFGEQDILLHLNALEAELSLVKGRAELADEMGERLRRVKRDFMETHSNILTPWMHDWLARYDALSPAHKEEING